MERNLKKWVVYLITTINLLIIATIGNNAFITDLILITIFGFNARLILKHDHKYINKEGDYEE